MKKFFSSLCDNLIDLYDYISRQSKKIDEYTKRIFNTNQKINSWFYSIPILGKLFKFLIAVSPSSYYSTSIDHKGLFEELGYEQSNLIELKKINRGSKCYIIILAPLIIVAIISIISALFSYVFIKNTTLFFDEYVKLIPLIIPFLILFTWVFPVLFFKLFFHKKKKSISIYTYGVLVAIIFPLFIIPQDYHHYYGKPIKIIGTVQNINTSRKNRYIIFSTNEDKLRKVKLSYLPRHILNNAKIGEKYIIIGRKSKFYFTYQEIKPSSSSSLDKNKNGELDEI